MFLHCHHCSWDQDDFWSKDGYNPFRQDLVDEWKEQLFKDKIYTDPKDGVIRAANYLGVSVKHDDEGFYLKGKDYVSAILYLIAIRIRNMEILTIEEAQEKRDNDTLVCPVCGRNDEMDVD